MDIIQLAKITLLLMVPSLAPVSSMDTNNTIWILKCCDVNQIIKDKGCGFDNTANLTVPVYENDHVTKDNSTNTSFAFYPITCVDFGEEYYIKLQPDAHPDQTFFVQNDGQLWVSKVNTSFSNHQFCLERHELFGVSAYVCVPGFQVLPEGDAVGDGVVAIGMTISLPFLLATFVIYALLPERTLHGMCLMSYVFALFWGCFLLSFCYIYSQFSQVSFLACRIIGASVYFFFELSFFWMNTIAYDIWSTFSGKKKSSNKRRLFLVYSSYAWGMSLFLVTFVITLSKTTSPTAWYHPGITGQECWIRDGIPQLLYWYGPLAILTIINICLFGSTTWKIWKTRKQTAILRRKENKTHSSDNEFNQSFYLYLKLLFAMGINWSIEGLPVVMNLVNVEVPNSVWYLGQFCNAAYGIFIFFMFTVKKNIWRSLQNRKFFSTTGTTSTYTT